MNHPVPLSFLRQEAFKTLYYGDGLMCLEDIRGPGARRWSDRGVEKMPLPKDEFVKLAKEFKEGLETALQVFPFHLRTVTIDNIEFFVVWVRYDESRGLGFEGWSLMAYQCSLVDVNS